MADTTTVKRLTTSTDDNSLPLFCNDPAAQAKGTTDFVFDFRSAVEWGGTLPTTGQPQPTGPFANLALDKSSVLGRDQAVTIANEGGPVGQTGDGRGLTFANGGTSYYTLKKAGVAAAQVCDPKTEGFRDFYLGAWIVLRAARADQANAGFFGLGQGIDISVGVWIEDDGMVGMRGVSRRIRPATVGALMHIGLHLAFDTAADNTKLRLFADGAEVGSQSDALFKPSQWPTTAGRFAIGSLGGFGSAEHTLARMTRTFTKWPGEGGLDPLKLHQDEERYNRARLA
ncbi:hypothetical protein SUS17_2117 [Sphingomonas sp. S17]|uniref:hypothetical protein n=1 Tax=Sphingomonas TaxID=13687 RepID=UPI00020A2604|nr:MULTISPECIES: hypothetical protein [Sphingomonas]EGI55031.1 hypothetical protein SUS17_2117 [Sphingomonas sp. S17]MCM3679486.1 hypothetical protein [Sphingomonas paucimobilis]